MSAAADRAEAERLTRLWFELCNCGGAQPSLNNHRADEHAKDCPYRAAVLADGRDEH